MHLCACSIMLKSAINYTNMIEKLYIKLKHSKCLPLEFSCIAINILQYYCYIISHNTIAIVLVTCKWWCFKLHFYNHLLLSPGLHISDLHLKHRLLASHTIHNSNSIGNTIYCFHYLVERAADESSSSLCWCLAFTNFYRFLFVIEMEMTFGISSFCAFPLSNIVFKSQIEELCGGKIFGLCQLTIHSQFRWFLEIRGYRSF